MRTDTELMRVVDIVGYLIGYVIGVAIIVFIFLIFPLVIDYIVNYRTPAARVREFTERVEERKREFREISMELVERGVITEEDAQKAIEEFEKERVYLWD